jgi:two-component system response regulator MprA
MADMLVLVVEDDPAVRASLERSLAFEGYTVVSAPDGVAGLEAVATHRPDVVVLDLGLPRLDGLEVCRRLRAAGDGVPVLMLTARESTGDRVRGLDAGADDYLPKPFVLEELFARLRALLRRAGATAASGQVLVVDDLRLDTAAREVTRAGRPISLTRTEYELLELLMLRPRQVLTRAQILAQVWGYDFDPGSNTLEVYVGYVRRKTEAGGLPRLLHTVRGVGYVVRPATVGPSSEPSSGSPPEREGPTSTPGQTPTETSS